MSNSGVPVVSDIAQAASNIAPGVADAVSSVGSAVVKTIENVAKNPLPVILQIGATVALGPAGLGLSSAMAGAISAGAVVAAQGGNIGDIAKSALLSYGAGNFASATGVSDLTTQIGQSISEATGSSMIGTAAMQGLNAAALNSAVAAVTGKPIGEAFSRGLVGGAVGSIGANLTQAAMQSSTAQDFFKTAQDWGITSPKALQVLQGATAVSINAALTGQSPTTAIQNYLVKSAANLAGSAFESTLKAAKQKLETFGDTGQMQTSAQERLDAYNTEFRTAAQQHDDLLAKNQPLFDKSNQLRDLYSRYEAVKNSGDVNAINAAVDAYNAAYGEYTALGGDEALTAASSQLDALRSQATAAQTQYEDVLSNFTDTVQDYNAAVGDLDQAYQDYEAQAYADATQQYNADPQAQLAAREALMQKLVNGEVETTWNEDGSQNLGNGIVFRDGEFYVGDELAFPAIPTSIDPWIPSADNPMLEDGMTPEERAAAEYQRYLDSLTNPQDPLTDLPAQDFGVEPEIPDDFLSNPFAGYSQNPDGTYTRINDDGSTLTLDQDGNILDVTMATDDGVQSIGNVGRPMTGGATGTRPPATRPPATRPPVVRPPTTQPTAPGGQPPAATTNDPKADQFAALMSLIGSQGSAVPQQATQPQLADIKYLYDIGGKDIFAPTQLENQPKSIFAASGGHLDDLLALLHRKD